MPNAADRPGTGKEIPAAEKETGSNLVSLPAACLFFVLCIAAGNAGMTALSAFLFGGFLLSLTAYLWAKYALSRVTLRVEGVSRRVFPGEQLSFRVRVSNEKALPLPWLDISFPAEGGKGVPALTHQVRHLRSGQEASWEETWTAERRGIVHIREAVLCSGDGFGLSVKRRHSPLETGLLFVVYPRVQQVNPDHFPRRNAELTGSGRGVLEDVTLMKNSRAYQAGDAARRINWRTLAGSGRLEVNQYETLLPGRVTVLPDLGAFSAYEVREEDGRREVIIRSFLEEELEEMISAAASLIFAFSQRGENTALVLPRTDRQEGGVFAGEDPENAVPELLGALAGIAYQGGPARFSGYEREILALPGEYVILSRNGKTARELPLLPVLPAHRTHVILLENDGDVLPYHVTDWRELLV